MKLKIKILKNSNNYSELKKNLNNENILIIENKEEWKNFFSQNIKRKNGQNITENFINKRILKNIKGFELIIEKIKFNKKILEGYFLDYSSFISIYLYFESDQNLLDYVKDTCEARGDKIVNNFNEAINYLANENVTIASVVSLEINQNQWDDFKQECENLLKRNK